ncbi:hypothetical protein EKG37_06205 [Robertmurraya yapensis]|uniref:Uncharacterized protein n=2 Tax=Bacillaceae TaxID=186817 RepID=A0A3S0K1U4_9BACI|nr:hypothetical protein [Bacillus yapensis]RTR33813.1 hypothetical protein EKG37_06205 [Bacillus yapensis]TKS97131.1 hypothetical protein FAR12_06205 [Bacillus yapensis]
MKNKGRSSKMYKLGNILIVSGIFLILLSTIGNFLKFLPEVLDSYYLASTGTVFTASGIILKKRKPLDRK